MAEVKPAGFFDLNLRFLNEVDNAQISYMKGEQTVELRTAPDCVKPVIRNLEAVLTFVQPLNKHHGLSMMEHIHREFPDNINTLANLIKMKKSFRMDTKAHEDKLEKMQSIDGNSLEQARCLLEIGYVLLSDLHTEVQKSVEVKLTDIMNQLKFQRRSITEHQQIESFDRAFQQLKGAKDAIQHILPETCINGTKREQNKAITYFEDGLALIEPGKSEAGIWKHHLARAHSRIGAGDRNISTTTEKKNHMHCALQNFQESISYISREEKIADPLKVYVARSYAYVGHLIATRRKEIKGTQEPLPSFVDQTLWDDPMKAFVEAHKIFDNDRVVHSRHGLTLKDKRFSAENKNTDTLKYIDMAIEQFNAALRIENRHNWFAYSQLLQAYLEKYKVQRQLFLNEPRSSLPEPKKSYLDEAIKNGERSIQQRVTSKTLLDITEAFYLKGMRPKKGKDGLDIVEDPSCLTSAQEYIQKALDHHNCKEHEKLKVLFGKCLFHIGDRKAGIEEILDVLTKKRNTITEPHYFRDLMIMMFNYFREWKDNRKNDVKIRQRRQKLRKIWCVLNSGKMTYKKRFKHPLIGMLNLYPHEFINMLMEVYRFKRRSKAEQELIAECLGALGKHHAQDVKRRLRDLEKVQPDQPDEVNVQRQGTSYDFCLCYSQEDAVWVKTFMEERDDIQELNGKRCFKAEDLEHEENTKFVFIISESFNNDDNCLSMLSTAKGKYPASNRLIPILTHNSTVLPDLLVDVVPMDFTGLRNGYSKFISALQDPVDDMNVPGAAPTPAPNVDIEGAAGSDQENMDVDEHVPVKRTKKDEQDFDEGTPWADQVEGSGAASDVTGTKTFNEDADMDS